MLERMVNRVKPGFMKGRERSDGVMVTEPPEGGKLAE
jgi:hypothetical protein